jgi:PAS domain S-box-containing protein
LERLRLSEERAHVVMQEATDGIYVVDERGHFTYVNPQIERYLGYPAAQLLDRHFETFATPESLSRAQFSLDRARSGEADEATYDLDLRRSDGAIRTFEINGRSLRDPRDGHFTGRFGIARDITERRQLERELARRTRALEALNAIATLAGRASNLDAILNEALDRTWPFSTWSKGRSASSIARRTSWRWPRIAATTGAFTARLARLRADTPLAELLLNAERPLLGNDLPRDVPVLADAASTSGIGKYGCVPLRSQEGTVGVLIVSGSDSRALSPSDGDTLAIIGAQLGAAIENARLGGRGDGEPRGVGGEDGATQPPALRQRKFRRQYADRRHAEHDRAGDRRDPRLRLGPCARPRRGRHDAHRRRLLRLRRGATATPADPDADRLLRSPPRPALPPRRRAIYPP